MTTTTTCKAFKNEMSVCRIQLTAVAVFVLLILKTRDCKYNIMDWKWAVDGVTDEVPRTTGPECINYMSDRRRWIEAILFTILLTLILRWAVKRLKPIVVPSEHPDFNRPHSSIRLALLIAMTLIFGIEMGFKLSEKTVIFVLNPCHIQSLVQIYLLAAKPSKLTIAMFRIQMNNLNGPFLAFLFPEVECRTMPFEQAAYWIQHALLYIIPVYILKTGAYTVEDFTDFNWVTIGVMVMLIYHFTVLNALSILTGINLNHMLCAALADPFQGQNYRIAAVIHESILCPILNKVTVLLFSSKNSFQNSINFKKNINFANTIANTAAGAITNSSSSASTAISSSSSSSGTTVNTALSGINLNNKKNTKANVKSSQYTSSNNSNINNSSSISSSSSSSNNNSSSNSSSNNNTNSNPSSINTNRMSNNLPLDLKLRKNHHLNTMKNDNDNTYLYHQQNSKNFHFPHQHQQQQHHLDIDESEMHYQLPTKASLMTNITSGNVSLAEEIAAAVASETIKHRFPHSVSGTNTTTSLATEYTMPTTKID